MAVTQVVEQEAVAAPRKARRAVRQPGAAWTSPAQLWRSGPMMRLLAEIWAIPEVGKLGVRADGLGIYVHVLMPQEDRAAEYRIYDVEADYLDATAPHGFDLMVTQLSQVPESIQDELIVGYEVLLER